MFIKECVADKRTIQARLAFLTIHSLLVILSKTFMIPNSFVATVISSGHRSRRLVQLSESNVSRVFSEALATHVQSVLADQSVPVGAGSASARAGSVFARMRTPQVLDTHCWICRRNCFLRGSWAAVTISFGPATYMYVHLLMMADNTVVEN